GQFGRWLGGRAWAVQQRLDIVANHARLQRPTLLRCTAAEELLEMLEIFLDPVLHEAHPFAGDILHAVDHESRALDQRLHVASRLLHRLSCGIASETEQLGELIHRALSDPSRSLTAVP